MSRNEIDLEAIIVQRVLVNFERFQQYETLQHSLRYILTFSQTTLTTPTKDTISFNTKKVTHLSHGNAIRRNVAIVFLTNLEPKNEPCPFLPASSAGHSQTAAPTSPALLKNLSSLSLSAAANRPRPTHGERERQQLSKLPSYPPFARPREKGREPFRRRESVSIFPPPPLPPVTEENRKESGHHS